MSITFNAERAIAECAGAVLAGLDETSAALGAQLRRALPELVADEDMAREFMASIRGNVAAGLSVIGAQEPVGDVRVPDEVLGYARMLVHRSVPMERLLHSYRIGQAQFWRLWLDALAERVDDRDLFIAALRLSSDRLDSYVDRVVSLLVAESEHEQERWLRRAVARRTELVQRLLRGELEIADVDAASADLGHELRAVQTALVIWSSRPDDAGGVVARIERCVAALLDSAGVRRALTLPVGTSSMWVWLATDDPPPEGLLAAAAGALPHLDVLIAGGRSVPGLDGFRSSHRQALRAQHVARLMPAPPRLTMYDDVGPISLLVDDEVEVREYVARELRALAGRDEGLGRLRQTLRVFLAEGGNARRASERLHTHRNTVLYRVQRAEQLLGHPVEQRRLELELALLLADALGEKVLLPG